MLTRTFLLILYLLNGNDKDYLNKITLEREISPFSKCNGNFKNSPEHGAGQSALGGPT